MGEGSGPSGPTKVLSNPSIQCPRIQRPSIRLFQYRSFQSIQVPEGKKVPCEERRSVKKIKFFIHEDVYRVEGCEDIGSAHVVQSECF